MKQDYQDRQVWVTENWSTLAYLQSHWWPKSWNRRAFFRKVVSHLGALKNHLTSHSPVTFREGKSRSNSAEGLNLLYHKWVQEPSLCFIFLNLTEFVSKPHFPQRCQWWCCKTSLAYPLPRSLPASQERTKSRKLEEDLRVSIHHWDVQMMVITQADVVHSKAEAPSQSFTEGLVWRSSD